jgi:hypothetical protein
VAFCAIVRPAPNSGRRYASTIGRQYVPFSHIAAAGDDGPPQWPFSPLRGVVEDGGAVKSKDKGSTCWHNGTDEKNTRTMPGRLEAHHAPTAPEIASRSSARQKRTFAYRCSSCRRNQGVGLRRRTAQHLSASHRMDGERCRGEESQCRAGRAGRPQVRMNQEAAGTRRRWARRQVPEVVGKRSSDLGWTVNEIPSTPGFSYGRWIGIVRLRLTWLSAKKG